MSPKLFSYLLILSLFSCSSKQLHTSLDKRLPNSSTDNSVPLNTDVELIILGTLQDGGLPHIGCKKSCCKEYFQNPNPNHKVVSLGIVDHQNNTKYIFEASPDFTDQIEYLNTQHSNPDESDIPNGIFVSHAHIGHYTGLMYLGKEAKNANQAMVYCMPKMQSFLSTNGPWSQLVSNKNIVFTSLNKDVPIALSENLIVTPFIVPHRDEYSETIGFKIKGPLKSILFIPDIDKWTKWNRSIVEEIQKVDLAFIDGTFYDGVEINYRNISDIPHPFVIESMDLFKDLSETEKSKIHFIHLNHTNPLNVKGSIQFNKVIKNGFRIAEYGSRIPI